MRGALLRPWLNLFFLSLLMLRLIVYIISCKWMWIQWTSCYAFNYLFIYSFASWASIYWISAFCKTLGWALINIRLQGSNIAAVKYLNIIMQKDGCYWKIMDIIYSFLVSSVFWKSFISKETTCIFSNK